VSCNNGLGTELGCPKIIHSIALIKRGTNDIADDCLKLVHLEANATCLPGTDDEIGYPLFLMNSWAIVTWSNTKMTSSWKDEHMDCRVQASDITMDSQIKSKLLQFGLLPEPRDGATAGWGLQNLLVSYPTPDISMADGDVVYLMARRKFMHPKHVFSLLIWGIAHLLMLLSLTLKDNLVFPPCIVLVPSPSIWRPRYVICFITTSKSMPLWLPLSR
jgi:hypothetical protein